VALRDDAAGSAIQGGQTPCTGGCSDALSTNVASEQGIGKTKVSSDLYLAPYELQGAEFDGRAVISGFGGVRPEYGGFRRKPLRNGHPRPPDATSAPTPTFVHFLGSITCPALDIPKSHSSGAAWRTSRETPKSLDPASASAPPQPHRCTSPERRSAATSLPGLSAALWRKCNTSPTAVRRASRFERTRYAPRATTCGCSSVG
jgi:hypothetical protein